MWKRVLYFFGYIPKIRGFNEDYAKFLKEFKKNLKNKKLPSVIASGIEKRN